MHDFACGRPVAEPGRAGRRRPARPMVPRRRRLVALARCAPVRGLAVRVLARRRAGAARPALAVTARRRRTACRQSSTTTPFAWHDAAGAACRCAAPFSTSCTSARSRAEGTFDGAIERLAASRRAGRRRRRADAGRRVPRRAGLGLRRRRPVRAAPRLRRPGRPEAARRRLPRARPRRRARRRLQPSRSGRELPAPSSARTSPTATTPTGATRSTSTGRAATRCAGSSSTTRSCGCATTTSTGCGSTPCTPSSTSRPGTSSRSSPSEVDALASARRAAAVPHRRERPATTRGSCAAATPAGYGLDAAWADEWHHALHAALTGEHVGLLRGLRLARVAREGAAAGLGLRRHVVAASRSATTAVARRPDRPPIRGLHAEPRPGRQPRHGRADRAR